MFSGSPLAHAMVGLALSVATAFPAAAQGNPFVPASAASKAAVEKIVEEKLKRWEERIKTVEERTEKPAFGDPNGAAGPGQMPGTFPGVGAMGSAVPGGMMPPMMIGAAGLPGGEGPQEPAPPSDPIEAARADGVRFVGCINGVHKFVRKTGERMTFSKSDISKAVASGVLPECR